MQKAHVWDHLRNYRSTRNPTVAWRDIDFQSKTFTITAKPDLGFTPKDFEERSVPLPDALVEALQERRRKNPGLSKNSS